MLPYGDPNLFNSDPLAQVVHEELPMGWQSVVDPNSSRIYYQHGASGRSSWERPGPTHETGQHVRFSPFLERTNALGPALPATR